MVMTGMLCVAAAGIGATPGGVLGVPSDADARAGTSSAQPCPSKSWARPSTCTLVVRISFSHHENDA